jgi:hypothetical protein
MSPGQIIKERSVDVIPALSWMTAILISESEATTAPSKNIHIIRNSVMRSTSDDVQKSQSVRVRVHDRGYRKQAHVRENVHGEVTWFGRRVFELRLCALTKRGTCSATQDFPSFTLLSVAFGSFRDPLCSTTPQSLGQANHQTRLSRRLGRVPHFATLFRWIFHIRSATSFSGNYYRQWCSVSGQRGRSPLQSPFLFVYHPHSRNSRSNASRGRRTLLISTQSTR